MEGGAANPSVEREWQLGRSSGWGRGRRVRGQSEDSPGDLRRGDEGDDVTPLAAGAVEDVETPSATQEAGPVEAWGRWRSVGARRRGSKRRGSKRRGGLGRGRGN